MKPIIGVTLFLKRNQQRNYRPIIFLAKNKTGYQNILSLVTAANLADGHTPFLQEEHINETLLEGVITLLPALNNEVREAYTHQGIEAARLTLSWYTTSFQEMYIGISPQDATPRDSTHLPDITKDIIALAQETKTGVIPLPLVYLLNEEDVEGRSVLLRIQTPALSNLEENIFEDNLVLPERKSIEEWTRTVYPQALTTLSSIISSISLELELGAWTFPTPPVPAGSDHVALFKEHIENGYAMRNIKKTDETDERVETELKTIIGRGYTDYFLSVIDLITFMRNNGILTTTRGSAAGSMVSFLSGITHVNPLEHRLPFERFLNPFRPSAPDIDIDIADNRRGDVIEYIIKRFGEEKVAQIGTLGTMMARAAVRDTARALGYSYLNGDSIARLIPLGKQGAPMYISQAMEEVAELRTLYESNETTRHIINVAKKIEGNARHLSVHAAGVVIAPTIITKYTPLEPDRKSESRKPITQYNMHAVEEAGLLKFDILGLTNLAILAEAIKNVASDKNEEVDIESIPMDDARTYHMIGLGYTTGIFQLGGQGMTAVLKRMKPTVIEDLAVVIALYRPGPMGNIDEYIDRKQGRKATIYMHPKMEGFLKKSYGVLVYQDDLLYTAIELAGFDWKEVDVFRKAVGKKIPELMAQQESVFKDRCVERGIKRELANKIWDLFDPFKGYGFNKSHAASYAKVAYQTAYMKANYPAQYMTAHLNAVAGNTDEVADIAYESKRIGLTILPPDINKSRDAFSTEPATKKYENIRIGLATTKQVGEKVAEVIMHERSLNGTYHSLEDFLVRMAPYKTLNRRNLSALIKVGVFDTFYERDILLENIDTLLQSLKDSTKNEEQNMLFVVDSTTLTLQPAAEKVSKAQELYWEKELLGTYISGHPLELFQQEGLYFRDIKRKTNQTRVLITGVIEQLKLFRNKSGEKMFFITLGDNRNETLDVVCPPEETKTYEELLAPYRPVKIRGKAILRNGEITVRVEHLEEPQPIPALEKN